MDEQQEHKAPLIKDLEEKERPREKVLEGKIKEMTDAELMALLFGTGIKGKSVISLCEEILTDNDGHLSKVTRMHPTELTDRYKGIGPAKAITLLAALELGARAASDALKMEEKAISSSADAAEYMRHHFRGLQHEEFWAVYFNRAGKPVRERRISQGGTAATTVDVKIIIKHALEALASSIILYHNHPSGTLRPSIEDDRLTKKIVDAAKYFDIRVNDHIIITDRGYYSYGDQGRI